jgi:hypothetical protein
MRTPSNSIHSTIERENPRDCSGVGVGGAGFSMGEDATWLHCTETWEWCGCLLLRCGRRRIRLLVDSTATSASG